MKCNLSIPLMALFSILFSITGCRNNNIRMVAGCISDNGESGINVFDFNSENGNISLVSSINAGPNPSYFALSRNRGLIYAINEVSVFGGKSGGGLTTLKYTGNFENIQKVSEMEVPNGGPCFISTTSDNRFLLIANYTGGSIAVVKLDKAGIPESVCDTIIYNGIGEKISNAHMIEADPKGERIYVTDLGLDRIMIYSLDTACCKLIPFTEYGIPLPEGTGPRHFAFNRDGSKMYVLGELNSTVNVFTTDADSGLIAVQTISTLREGYSGRNYSADIHLSESGKFLYGSNRGENTIVTFRIMDNGKLTLEGHTDCGGDWPRNFVIDPSGKYILAGNQRTGNIAVLKLNPKSGIPELASQNTKLKDPACLKFK